MTATAVCSGKVKHVERRHKHGDWATSGDPKGGYGEGRFPWQQQRD
jgi:hypothetical protein